MHLQVRRYQLVMSASRPHQEGHRIQLEPSRRGQVDPEADEAAYEGASVKYEQRFLQRDKAGVQ